MANQQDGAEHGRGKDCERRNPRDQIEAMCGGRCQYSGAVFGHERVENHLITIACGDAASQFHFFLPARRAACVVAPAQQLRTATRAHQFASHVFKARTCVRRSHREANCNRQQERLRRLNPESEAPRSSHQSPPFNAGSAEAVRAAGTRNEAVAGVKLGTRAIPVPKTISTTPAHIQLTSGLRNALMMGWPVSGLVPSYTT